MPGLINIPVEKTMEEVDNIERLLRLKKGDRILDLCCGIGRHAIELARRGYNVTGVDVSPAMLEYAKKCMQKEKVNCRFILCDMREIDFKNEFDACINMFTAFGYFDDEENKLVLENVYRALVPGGKFLMELVNRDWIIRNYREHDWECWDDTIILEERNFDPATSINYSRVIFIKNGKKHHREIKLRVYSYHELKKLLREVGFKNIEGYDRWSENKITIDTSRMVIFANK